TKNYIVLCVRISGKLTGSSAHGLRQQSSVVGTEWNGNQCKGTLLHMITTLSYNMGKCADSSKQRTRLRAKITTEKVALQKSVSLYNSILNDDVNAEDVANGVFKWIDENVTYSEDMPIRTKRLVVEKWMSNYLMFYKTLVFSLHQRNNELESLHSDNDVDEPLLLRTYATLSSAPSIKHGKIALIKRGEDSALCQLARGIKSFSVVLNRNIEEFEQLFDDLSDTESESDGDIIDHDSESDVDEIGSNVSLNILPEKENGLESIIGELACDDVICWKFPASVSQSTLAGNDESNACSIIATLLGYKFLMNELDIQDDTISPLCLTWINTVCKCISIDPYQPSTIVAQLAHLMNSDKSVAQLIIHERTSVFLSKGSKIVYFDSHLHPPYGAVLVSGSMLNLDDFCSYIWNLEAHDIHEFGNLVHTTYPDA
ncbi:Hypothetical predicted protein, partial [Paramuricea clavata]